MRGKSCCSGEGAAPASPLPTPSVDTQTRRATTRGVRPRARRENNTRSTPDGLQNAQDVRASKPAPSASASLPLSPSCPNRTANGSRVSNDSGNPLSVFAAPRKTRGQVEYKPISRAMRMPASSRTEQAPVSGVAAGVRVSRESSPSPRRPSFRLAASRKPPLRKTRNTRLYLRYGPAPSSKPLLVRCVGGWRHNSSGHLLAKGAPSCPPPKPSSGASV